MKRILLKKAFFARLRNKITHYILPLSILAVAYVSCEKNPINYTQNIIYLQNLGDAYVQIRPNGDYAVLIQNNLDRFVDFFDKFVT